jgi:hypothetical protein
MCLRIYIHLSMFKSEHNWEGLCDCFLRVENRFSLDSCNLYIFTPILEFHVTTSVKYRKCNSLKDEEILELIQRLEISRSCGKHPL